MKRMLSNVVPWLTIYDNLKIKTTGVNFSLYIEYILSVIVRGHRKYIKTFLLTFDALSNYNMLIKTFHNEWNT